MMEIYKEKNSQLDPLVSIIIIDSRSSIKPDWVRESFNSALSQNIPVEVIVINNTEYNEQGETKYTIGQCWNEGVKHCTTPWILFLGDDDTIVFDLAETLYRFSLTKNVTQSQVMNISSFMMVYDDETGKKTFIARQHTGMWKREYLLQYPFNEQLKKGIDREYQEEAIKRGQLSLIIEYYFGYQYRRHNLPHCAGTIQFIEKPAPYYFLTSNRQFLHPITERLAKSVGGDNIIVSPHATEELVNGAELIWVEWANDKAIDISMMETKAKKILRLHAYEAFHESIKKINLNGFDTVIFIDNYIKDYVERQYGKVNGAVVIPNGVETGKFNLNPQKIKNNKIAYAGYLSRKKGIGELILLAESNPDYEFHLAGRYQEDDIADYLNYRKPSNVFIENWKYDEALPEFFNECSYVLNTSLRESQGMTICEGMSCGCSPIIRGWLGANDMYKDKWIYNNMKEFRQLLENPTPPEECRQFILDNYDVNNIYPKIEGLLLKDEKVLKVS